MTKDYNIGLDGFFGTESYHRLTIVPIVCTDGVKYFAEKFEAFWLINEISLKYYYDKKVKKQEFIVINVESKNGKATVKYEDGNYNKLLTNKYDTDLKEGKYKFYLVDNVLLLPSEY